MKRYYIFLLAIILTACNDSSSIGGKYYVNRSDSSHVYISKKSTGRSFVVVDDQVVDWERVGGYLVVLRKVAQSPDCYDEHGVATIITHYSDKSEFWIFDLKESIEYGPYDATSYKLKLSQLKLPFIALQTPKGYYANTGYFNKFIKSCKRLVYTWK